MTSDWKGAGVQLSGLLYQFIIGGIIFTIGVVVPFRAGDYSLARREDRRTLGLMVAGVLGYLVATTLWHFAAVG